MDYENATSPVPASHQMHAPTEHQREHRVWVQRSAGCFDEPLQLLFFCLGFWQPHAHSPRLTLPFTHSVSIHKEASLQQCVSVIAKTWGRENWPGQHWECGPGYYRFYGSVFGLAYGRKQFHWMSLTHTQCTFSLFGSFKLRVGVGPGHMRQKIQIVSAICPPSVPHGFVSACCSLTMSQSLQTPGEHRCAYWEVLWSCCRPVHMFFCCFCFTWLFHRFF